MNIIRDWLIHFYNSPGLNYSKYRESIGNSAIFECSMFLYTLLSYMLVVSELSVRAVLRDKLNLTTEWMVTETRIVLLIEKCFLRDDRTVSLIGDVPENLVKKLHEMEIAATASVGDYRSRAGGLYEEILYSKLLYHEMFWIGQQRIVHAFVISAASEVSLRIVLEKAKSSVWWNSEGFFIATSTSKNNNCRNAFNYLWTLWEMGILNAIFLCEDHDGSLATYGYSPYYDGHGESWRKVQVHAGRGEHPWTLLKLEPVHDVDPCELVTFDKVRKLDGYPIIIGTLAIPPTLLINKTGKTWLSKHIGEDAAITSIIWKALNGSMQPKYYNEEDPIGFAAPNESYTGFMSDISLGRVDHGMNGLLVSLHWRMKSAYPHAISGVYFFTPSKGNMPNWLKFVNIYDIHVIVGILATLFTGMIFLRYVDNRPLSSAILDVFRVAMSMTMSRWPRRFSSTIFWSLSFFAMLLFTSCLQGLLVSLLTKPTPYRNIDEVDDLLASGYNIYGHIAFNEFFNEPKFMGKFQLYRMNTTCFTRVEQGDPIACVSDYMYLRSNFYSKASVHMSKKPLLPFYTGFMTKSDWPLFQRFNTLVQRLFNAGITGYLREYYLDLIVRKNWAEMRRNLPPNLKVLSLTDLTFIFHILDAGLLCSLIAFFVERILGGNRRLAN